MRRLLLSVVACGALLAGTLASSALAQEAPASRVVVLQVVGPIDEIVEGYLLDGIADAEEVGATVVIQLDAPGTLDIDPLALATRVHDSSVPVLVWVGPAPADAAGAGLLLVHAASLAGVAPGAAIGPLLPLDVAHPDEVAPDLDATVERWLAERDRSVARVTGGPITAQRAIDSGVVEVAAPSVTDFLAKVDGRTVQTAGGEVVLRTKVALEQGQQPVEVAFTSLGPWERVLHAAATPSSVFLLLVLGAAALAFELTQPGFGFAGFSGLALVGLGAYGLTIVPASPLGLALLALGIVALCLDVVARRLAWPSVVGILAFLAGSLLAFRDVAPSVAISPWAIGASVVGTILFYGFVLTVALQSRDRITSTQQGLVGLAGQARTDLRPEGGVYVKGTMWRGRAVGEPILAGTPVRVKGIDGLVLRVEADPTAAGAGPDDARDAEPEGETGGEGR